MNPNSRAPVNAAMRERDEPIVLTPNLIDCWRYELAVEIARYRDTPVLPTFVASDDGDARAARLEAIRMALTCLQRAHINKAK